MTIDVNDIRFLKGGVECSLAELDRADVGELCDVLEGSVCQIYNYSNIRLMLPGRIQPVLLCQFKACQLFPIKVLLRGIYEGRISAECSIKPEEFTVGEAEKRLIASLAKNDLNISDVAKEMDVHRNTVYAMIDRFAQKTGINIGTFSGLREVFSYIEV